MLPQSLKKNELKQVILKMHAILYSWNLLNY